MNCYELRIGICGFLLAAIDVAHVPGHESTDDDSFLAHKYWINSVYLTLFGYIIYMCHDLAFCIG